MKYSLPCQNKALTTIKIEDSDASLHLNFIIKLMMKDENIIHMKIERYTCSLKGAIYDDHLNSLFKFKKNFILKKKKKKLL